MVKLKQILLEGGLGGHIKHPYEIVNSGPELIDLFKNIVDSINSNKGSVKFDGVNASVKYNGKEFVLDRGSANILDINGVSIKDLQNRFINKKDSNTLHPFIKIGNEVLSFFNKTKPYCENELSSLGILKDPSLVFNIEYIDNKDSNVIKYNANYIVFHGIKKIVVKRYKSDGTISSREAINYDYNVQALQNYVKKLNEVCKDLNINIKVLGQVPINKNEKLNINIPLNENLKLYPNENGESKSLNSWLMNVKYKPDIKFTKNDFILALRSKNMTEEFGIDNVQDILNYTILIIGSIKMGNYILNNTSANEIGELRNQEGIVINDPSISSDSIKITGKFFFNALKGGYAK